jgi:hypothetical protein
LMTPAAFRCFQSLFSSVNSSVNVADDLPVSPLKGMNLLWEMSLGVTSKTAHEIQLNLNAEVDFLSFKTAFIKICFRPN